MYNQDLIISGAFHKYYNVIYEISIILHYLLPSSMLRKCLTELPTGRYFINYITCGVPVYIVRILSFWYSMQLMKVRWGDYVTEPFHVTNGVKQGGILSPALFILYTDDFSV